MEKQGISSHIHRNHTITQTIDCHINRKYMKQTPLNYDKNSKKKKTEKLDKEDENKVVFPYGYVAEIEKSRDNKNDLALLAHLPIEEKLKILSRTVTTDHESKLRNVLEKHQKEGTQPMVSVLFDIKDSKQPPAVRDTFPLFKTIINLMFIGCDVKIMIGSGIDGELLKKGQDFNRALRVFYEIMFTSCIRQELNMLFDKEFMSQKLMESENGLVEEVDEPTIISVDKSISQFQNSISKPPFKLSEKQLYPHIKYVDANDIHTSSIYGYKLFNEMTKHKIGEKNKMKVSEQLHPLMLKLDGEYMGGDILLYSDHLLSDIKTKGLSSPETIFDDMDIPQLVCHSLPSLYEGSNTSKQFEHQDEILWFDNVVEITKTINQAQSVDGVVESSQGLLSLADQFIPFQQVCKDWKLIWISSPEQLRDEFRKGNIKSADLKRKVISFVHKFVLEVFQYYMNSSLVSETFSSIYDSKVRDLFNQFPRKFQKPSQSQQQAKPRKKQKKGGIYMIFFQEYVQNLQEKFPDQSRKQLIQDYNSEIREKFKNLTSAERDALFEKMAEDKDNKQ